MVYLAIRQNHLLFYFHSNETDSEAELNYGDRKRIAIDSHGTCRFSFRSSNAPPLLFPFVVGRGGRNTEEGTEGAKWNCVGAADDQSPVHTTSVTE